MQRSSLKTPCSRLILTGCVLDFGGALPTATLWLQLMDKNKAMECMLEPVYQTMAQEIFLLNQIVVPTLEENVLNALRYS